MSAVGLPQDCIELSAGLVSLCGGTSEDKVAAAFALYDENNDGVIEFSEMVAFLTAAFQVLFKVEQASGATFDTTPAEFAERTCDAAFQEVRPRAHAAAMVAALLLPARCLPSFSC